ncbi:hypothetical protein ACIBQ1_12795 [Nonomuraea sp. NPDC050153]|uniref:hypothetical protein n=1 Tax=Nonomuraea sp. NPDC050153 TaxID=3364359 RepID=UPI0037989390
MTTLALHLSVAMLTPMPTSTDTRALTLFLLTTLITLAAAAIRWMVKRTSVVMVISGTGVLVIILSVLLAAYVITFGAA